MAIWPRSLGHETGQKYRPAEVRIWMLLTKTSVARPGEEEPFVRRGLSNEAVAIVPARRERGSGVPSLSSAAQRGRDETNGVKKLGSRNMSKKYRDLAATVGIWGTFAAAPAHAEPGALNWSFEGTLEGWVADGTAFTTQPTCGNNVVTSRVRRSASA
jgi:hypothetical protein